MVSFLKTEREKAGWRFLVLWLGASVVCFVVGLGIEWLIYERITLYIAIPLSAIGQASMVNRHVSIYLPWAIGTTLFWIIGMAIASQVFMLMVSPDTILLQVAYLVIISATGGLFAAIPQWFFLRDWLPQIGLWWLPLSALSYGLFFLPGVINGVVLMIYITEDKVPMEGRRYKLSGQF